jgi:hypothetical protein
MMGRRSTSSRALSGLQQRADTHTKGVTVRYHNDTNAQTTPIINAIAASSRIFRLTPASWRAPFSCHRAHRSSKVRAFPTVNNAAGAESTEQSVSSLYRQCLAGFDKYPDIVKAVNVLADGLWADGVRGQKDG